MRKEVLQEERKQGDENKHVQEEQMCSLR